MAPLAIGFPIATLLLYRTAQPTWILISFVGFSFVGVLALLETATSFVDLDESRLLARRTFKTIRIARADIEKIAVAKGCPILVITKNGRKIEMPDLGVRGLDNSLRAWIKGDSPEVT